MCRHEVSVRSEGLSLYMGDKLSYCIPLEYRRVLIDKYDEKIRLETIEGIKERYPIEMQENIGQH